VPREKITGMTTMALSTMPAGLLNSFEREEILDLLAYVRSLEAPAEN
jgi:hypothetical protein